MARTYDCGKLGRLIKLHWVLQLFLVVLLIFMSVNFQEGLLAEGRPERFLHSVIFSIILQLLVFSPLKRFAAGEVEREMRSAGSDLSVDELKELRQKRIFSDYIKGAIIVFFFTFAWLAPQDRFILCTILITFILTLLTYFQCYNYLARRAIREKSGL